MRTQKLLRGTLSGFLGAALAIALGPGFVLAQVDTSGNAGMYGSSRTNAGTGINADAGSQSAATTNTQGTGSANVSADAFNSGAADTGASAGAVTQAGPTTGASGNAGGAGAMSGIFVPGTAHLLLLSTPDLTVGSVGQEVTALQGFLAELGFLDLTGIGGPTGYYGELTEDAVARYQSALGVPATGYFGPMTRSAMTNHFARNGWTDTFAGTTGITDGIGGGESSDLVGTLGTGGGTDLPGVFSVTNPGTTFNGVWYPYAADMSVTAPTDDTGTAGTNGTAGETDDTDDTDTGNGTIDLGDDAMDSTGTDDAADDTDDDVMGP